MAQLLAFDHGTFAAVKRQTATRASVVGTQTLGNRVPLQRMSSIVNRGGIIQRGYEGNGANVERRCRTFHIERNTNETTRLRTYPPLMILEMTPVSGNWTPVMMAIFVALVTTPRYNMAGFSVSARFCWVAFLQYNIGCSCAS